MTHREKFWLAADPDTRQYLQRRSEVQRTRMPDRGRPRLRRPQRADLAKRGFHFVDHELPACNKAEHRVT